MNRKKPKVDLPVIDALRVFAVLWILFFHLCPGIPFISLGFLGVDVLFAISGFLVAYHYTDTLLPFDRNAYIQFLKARLARIYPLHVFILLLLAAMLYAAPALEVRINTPQDFTLLGFLSHVFLVSAWNFPSIMSWNYFAWAISALWLMYLLSPLFIKLASLLRNRIAVIVAGALLLAVTPCIHNLWPYDSFVAYAIPRAISGFGIGILIYRWSQITKPSWNISVGNYRIIRFIAEISYAVYMVQYIVMLGAKKLFPHEPNALYIATEIAIIFVFAYLVHIVIEKPARRFLTAR